jgi:predicted component of type VI protein secretion system
MANVPHDQLVVLREKINQQRNTVAALKRDGHECTDAERHLRDLLAEEQGLNTLTAEAPGELTSLRR